MKREGAIINRPTTLWGSAVFAALGCASITAALGQVTFSSTSGLVYSQNFNALAASGTGGNTPIINRWNDNDAAPDTFDANGNGGLLGWYVKSTGGEWSNNSSNEYNAGAGGSSSSDMWSYGTGTGTDRALGTLPTANPGGAGTTSGNFYTGLYLQYTGATTLNQLQVIFRGEQWRDGVADSRTLKFEYQISSSAISLTAGTGWQSVTALDFASMSNTAAGARDGNSASYSAQKNTTFTTNVGIQQNYFIMLRWTNPNPNNSADHGLAIDDVIVAVPEAGTWAAGGLLSGLALTGYLRNRSRRVTA